MLPLGHGKKDAKLFQGHGFFINKIEWFGKINAME